MQKIFLVPVNFSNATLLRRIYSKLTEVFPHDVKISEIKIDTESAFSSERNQYYSTKLISDAISRSKHLDGKIVLLVEFDLYVPVFTFVFGEAQLNGKLSVVSLCRLHEEFYTGDTNEELLLDRAMKELLHELGHNFGLLHCMNWECVMHSSAIIEQVDIKGGYYCDKCLALVPQLKAVVNP